jgi:DNA-binding XRE family transcriptional regulator
MPVTTPSSSDKKRAAARASKWKQFRRDYLYSQPNLAYALDCSRRTIVSIEGGETINPHPDLLRRFRDLRRKHERDEAAYADISAFAHQWT